MNSHTLTKVRPFLPKQGVRLDCLNLDDPHFRWHRWAWESLYPQMAEEYGSNPLIFQALELPDQVINAAASRLFENSFGFGMSRIGISQTHMEIISAALFGAHHAEIQIGGGSTQLWQLYNQAKARMHQQSRETAAVENAVALFS